jgi:P63C domain
MSEDVTGKAKGGFARAESLSPEKRAAIAKRAALKRWKGVGPSALHEGDLNLAGVTLSCAVLDTGQRVLSQSAFMKALNRARQAKGRTHYKGDVELPAFLTAQNLKPFIPESLKVTSSQIEFKAKNGTKAYGYSADLLPQVISVFIDADRAGVLTHMQKRIAERAYILSKALMNVAIVALIDEVTGYQDVRPKDALQAYLEKLIAKELAAWAKKFPDEFYENIYKLKGWPWPGMSVNRYSVVAHYTNDLVYERLAPGLRKALEGKNPKNEKGWRPAKNHQWLTADIGDPMLAQHLYSLVMFQRLAISSGFGWNRFVKMIDRVHPKKGATLELPFPEEDI